jgi:chromobox protein 1
MTTAKPTTEKPTTKRRKLISKEEANGIEFSEADIGSGIPDWVHDKEHWGRDVVKVQTIENDEVHGLVAYLIWTNGKTTKVSINLCYESIPMLVRRKYSLRDIRC